MAININADIDENENEIDVEITESSSSGGTSDYRQLTNLPTINGTRLVTNYNETDPTVQSWAKTNSGISVAKSVPSDAVFTDTTYTVATTNANGLMSSTDKSKLDGIDLTQYSTTTQMNTAISSAISAIDMSGYVVAVSGKQLSTEDFTTAEKTKLDGIDLSKYSTTEQMNSAINTAIDTKIGDALDDTY